MMFRRSLFCLAVLLFLSGCSDVVTTEPPAALPTLGSIPSATPSTSVPTEGADATLTPKVQLSPESMASSTPEFLFSLVGGVAAPEMRTLAAGEFVIGTLDGEFDEQPRHKVVIGKYSIDTYEVSNALYAQCVDAEACEPPVEPGSATRDSYFGDPGFDNYPVIHVTWHMAKTYCEWRGGRLPTEVEWERAGWSFEGFKYGWGNYLDCGYLNYKACNKNDTTPVDKYQWGGYDKVYGLPGNVWEWTSSLYVDYPYFVDDEREDPESDGARVLRGGSYNELPDNVTITTRKGASPFEHFAYVGFRCVVDVEEE